MNLRQISYFNLNEKLEELRVRSSEDGSFSNLNRLLTSESVIRLAENMTRGKRSNLSEIRRDILHSRHIDNLSVVETCFYIVLEPIVEGKLSDRVYGHRPNLTEKHALSYIASIVWKRTLPMYLTSFKLRWNKRDHIEGIVDAVRNVLHIRDVVFLKRLKSLLYNLEEDNKLIDMLSNVYLKDIDDYLDGEYTHFRTISKKGNSRFKYLNNYVEKRGCIPLSYVRYGNDIMIATYSQDLAEAVKVKIRGLYSKKRISVESHQDTDLTDNLEVYHLDFLSYRVHKTSNGTSIRLIDLNDRIKHLKKLAVSSKKYSNYSRFVAEFMILMNDLDIVSNIEPLMRWIYASLNVKHRNGTIIDNRVISNDPVTYLLPSGHKYRDGFIFCPWLIRKNTKTSVSIYMSMVPYRRSYIEYKTIKYIDDDFLRELRNRDFNSPLIAHLPALLKKSKYTCYVTGRILTPTDYHIHHVKPLSKGGSDSIDNLVLLDKSIHLSLHRDMSNSTSLEGLSLTRFEKLRNYIM